MPFVVVKAAEAVAHPSALLLLCAAAGLALLSRGRSRAGLALLAFPIVFALLLLLLPLDSWLLAPLEDRFPPLRVLPARVTGIICLGGAVDPELTEARGLPSLNAAAERMTAFVTLALARPEARLAFTGGSGRMFRGRLSEADVARQLFDGLGLAVRPVTYENRSRTTWENAVDLGALLHPHPGETWILVTSAAHMPRAIAAFRSAGWPVLADPVGYKTAHSLVVELAPTLPQRLDRIDAAAHEWAGLLVYRLLGRTDRLLPEPD